LTVHRRLLYIVNPISGTKDKQELKEIIRQETERAGLEYEIYPSVASGDYRFLHPVLKEKKITDVIIAGGDGTVNRVVNSFKGFNVQFGIIPLGSGNGLALSASIPKNAKRALHTIFEGKSEWTDAVQINDQFSCMLCGLGLDAQVAIDFADDPRRGLATYVKKTLNNFLKARTYPFELTVGDKVIRTDAFFINVANSNQFGNNFTIAPQASLSDGLLDIVIMTRQNKLSVLLQAIRQVGGFNKVQQLDVINEQANVLYFQAEQLTISNPESAPLHIDGDPAEAEKFLNIQVLKHYFRLIK
jgi:diacylglycerol kinase (ATP)